MNHGIDTEISKRTRSAREIAATTAHGSPTWWRRCVRILISASGVGLENRPSATDDEPANCVRSARVVRGEPIFFRASERTLDSRADLRWGPDGKGVRRLVHPNGVCLIGRWRITQPTDYSGYFSSGSEALAIARYSTCCAETRRGIHARCRWSASCIRRPIQPHGTTAHGQFHDAGGYRRLAN